MQKNTRRHFIRSAAGAGPLLGLGPALLAAGKDDPDRFPIGIQEYTFHRWIGSGKLKHLDYPALAKEKLGITHIEYWNRPFNGKHTDRAYVGELVKRTTGEGMKNVLILVDAKNQLDAADAAQRARAVDEHKGWIDCAAQLGCDAVRVNCRSGGKPEENLKHAADGLGTLCDYAKPTPVKVVIEPHGGNSQDPDWLLAAMKLLDRPNAGLLPDFNNFGRYDRYEAVAKSLPYAPALCAKALKFDAQGNETRTDYFKMLKIVYDSAFSGVISIEFEGHGIDPVEGSLKTKTLIEKALKAAAAG
jgi:sugar phosphate isomerase/epimerase